MDFDYVILHGDPNKNDTLFASHLILLHTE